MLNLIFSLLFSWATPASPSPIKEVFRFHLLTEIQTLDPQTSSASSGNYLFHNLYRGLFSYSREHGLRPEGARSCRRENLKLICNLKKNKWSNDQAITAQDYLRSFRRLIDPQNRSPQADILFGIKNAREIWAGHLPPDRLGISAPDTETLVFQFEAEDPEFEYRLIHPALSPYPPGGFRSRTEAAQMPTSGPYKVTEWKIGSWVRLEPNFNYRLGNPSRPPAEALFIDEDSTALRLFENGKLSFLRRLPVEEFSRFQDRPEFKKFPMARFDYIGFGPSLLDQEKVRLALVKGIEFQDFKRLFNSISPAGCPSLPSSYMDQVNCLKPDFNEARSLGNSVKPPKLEMYFSKMGGDDISRAAEWFQGQWKKHIGWTVELNSQEQAVYLRMLREKPPAIFRKGVSLDRPTCLAALEIFLKNSPENFIRLNDEKYERLVNRLQQPLSTEERKKSCRIAVDHLMSLNRIIPLGQMYFTVLASPKFQGWELNELNQLDLSQLKVQ